MNNLIRAALAAVCAVASTNAASAQSYYMRQALGKIPAATAAAPIAYSVCETLKPLYTISNYGAFKSGAAVKTLAEAKTSCEAVQNTAVCYVIEDTTPSTGSIFYPITSPKGTVNYVGSFPGQVNYASTCKPK